MKFNKILQYTIISVLFMSFYSQKASADSMPLVDIFSKEVENRVTAELDKIKKELQNSKTDPQKRLYLFKRRKKLEKLRAKTWSTQMGIALVNGFRSIKSSLNQMKTEIRTGYSGAKEINPAFAGYKKILENRKQLLNLKIREKSGKIISSIAFLHQLQSLKNDINSSGSTGLSPATKRLAQSLTIICNIMANYMGDIPYISAFIQAYGNIGGEFVKLTVALDKILEKSEGGELTDGVHGSRKTMLKALRATKGKSYHSARKIPGFLNLYREHKTGDLIIWNPKTGKWVVCKDFSPGITVRELLKRYIFYAKKGNKNPTPLQILRGYKRTIVLKLSTSNSIILPEGKVTLRVLGTMLHNGSPSPRHRVIVTLKSHTGVGKGKFLSKKKVKVGDTVIWKAPNNANEKYQFSVDFTTEAKKVVSRAGRSTKTIYTAGKKTKIKLESSKQVMSPGESVKLKAYITDDNGKLVNRDRLGRLSLKVYRKNKSGHKSGYFLSYKYLPGKKGGVWTWKAPISAGEYTVIAKYEGGHSPKGYFSNYLYGSTAKITLKVKTLQYKIFVDKTKSSTTFGKAARFVIKVKNNDLRKARIWASTRDLAHERVYWKIDVSPHSTLVKPQGSVKFVVTAKPLHQTKAKEQQIKVTISPGNGGSGHSVRLKVFNMVLNGKNSGICNEKANNSCRAASLSKIKLAGKICGKKYKKDSCEHKKCIINAGVVFFKNNISCSKKFSCTTVVRDVSFLSKMLHYKTCFDKNSDCTKCMIKENSPKTCNSVQYEKCKELSLYYLKKQRLVCNRNASVLSCPWHKCTNNILNKFYTNNMQCARQYGCTASLRDKNNLSSIRKKLACISKNGGKCSNCFGKPKQNNICNEISHKKCRKIALSRMKKNRTRCYWHNKTMSCSWQKCMLSNYLKYLSEVKVCAKNSSCTIPQNEIKSRRTAIKRLTCAKQSKDCKTCFTLGEKPRICDNNARLRCEKLSLNRMIKKRTPCYWKFKEGSCSWHKCIIGVGVKYFDEKRQCAIKSNCNVKSAVNNTLSIMKRRQNCIFKGKKSCGSCSKIGAPDKEIVPVVQCSSLQTAGADRPEKRTVNLGKKSGFFTFYYQTFRQKDRITITHDGKRIFDTGCVGASKRVTIKYSGKSTKVTVSVLPNCSGGSGTAWNFNVQCPTASRGDLKSIGKNIGIAKNRTILRKRLISRKHAKKTVNNRYHPRTKPKRRKYVVMRKSRRIVRKKPPKRINKPPRRKKPSAKEIARRKHQQNLRRLMILRRQRQRQRNRRRR